MDAGDEHQKSEHADSTQTDEVSVPTGIASKMLGIPVHTIRRWCTWHSDLLSTSATPEQGNRRLTPHDLDVLREVARLRAMGMQTNEINERLHTSPVVVVDGESQRNDTERTPNAQEGPGTAIALQQVQTVMQPVFDAMTQRLAAVEQQQRDIAEQQRDSRRSFMLGVLVGVLAVGVVIIALALLVGQ